MSKPIDHTKRELGPPCELCTKPVTVGQVVLCYDDVGEVHANCEDPFSLTKFSNPDGMTPVVLLDRPMIHLRVADVVAVRNIPISTVQLTRRALLDKVLRDTHGD